MSAPANALTITINADTAEAAARVEKFFHAFADNAEKLTGMASFLEEFGRKVAAVFAIGSITEFTKRAIEAEATLERMSQKSGITVGMLAALRSEAGKNGLAFEELDAGLTMFADHIFQAVRHGGQFAQVFRDLKIPLNDATGQLRPIDSILLDVARKFQDMPAGPQKAALALEMFGRSGRQFIQLLSMSTEQLVARMKEHGAEEERNAKQAEEFHRSLMGLSQMFMSIWKQLGNDLLPKLQEFVESMKATVQWFQSASKEGGTLNMVLKQTAILFSAVALARAGASFSLMFGGVGSLQEMVIALGLITTRLKSIALTGAGAFLTSPVVHYTLVIAALNEALQTGVELWRMYAAEKAKALTDEQVKNQDTNLEVSLLRAIDAQQKAGTINAKIAEIYRNAVHDAFKTSPDAIALHDRLTNLMRSLRTHADKGQQQHDQKQATVGPSDQEIKTAEARYQAALKAQAATDAIAEAENELSYKKRQISMETYFAVKKALLERGAHDEVAALQKELRLVDQQIHDPQNAANKEKQDELSIKREEVRTKLIEQQAKLRAGLKKIEGDQFTEQQTRAKEAEQLEQGRAELRLSHIKAEQALVAASPYLTDIQKAQQLIPLLKNENDEIAAQIALEQKRQLTANLKPAANLESQKKVEALKEQVEQLNLKLRETEDSLTFGGQFKSQFVQLGNSFGTVAQNLAKGWGNVVTSMRDGFATAIDDMIWKGTTFSKAMGQFGLAILHSMVQSFAQMTASWIMQHTVMAAWSSLFHAKETAETAAHTATQVGIHATGETAKTGATAAGSSSRGAINLAETVYHGLLTGFRVITHIAAEVAMTAASLAQGFIRRIGAFMEAQPYIFLAAVKAASSVADIPFVGPVLAPIAAATTFAALEALAVFREGGYTGDGPADAPAGIVHKGEFVFPKHIVSKLGLANLQVMARSAMMPAPMVMNSVAPAPRVMGNSRAGSGDVHLHVWDDGAKMKNHIRNNTDVQHEIIELIGKQVHRIVRR